MEITRLIGFYIPSLLIGSSRLIREANYIYTGHVIQDEYTIQLIDKHFDMNMSIFYQHFVSMALTIQSELQTGKDHLIMQKDGQGTSWLSAPGYPR